VATLTLDLDLIDFAPFAHFRGYPHSLWWLRHL